MRALPIISNIKNIPPNSINIIKKLLKILNDSSLVIFENIFILKDKRMQKIYQNNEGNKINPEIKRKIIFESSTCFTNIFIEKNNKRNKTKKIIAITPQTRIKIGFDNAFNSSISFNEFINISIPPLSTLFFITLFKIATEPAINPAKILDVIREDINPIRNPFHSSILKNILNKNGNAIIAIIKTSPKIKPATSIFIILLNFYKNIKYSIKNK